MIRGSCHCGAVTFELAETPAWLTACNCSICRRIGSVWAHAEMGRIALTAAADATLAYAWGDKSLAFHTCRNCGCTTHWEPMEPAPQSQMAVNCRMADPADIAGIRIRHFDGADTWSFVD